MRPVVLQVFDYSLDGSTIIRGDTADELDALWRHGSGEILAHGGVTFVQSLARLDVVDEY
jgi:hypothetical protein